MARSNSKNIDIDSDEISLKELILEVQACFRYLLARWMIILFGGIIGGGIGLAYALSRPTLYQAELSFALQDEKSSSGGLNSALGLASQMGINLGGGAGGEFSGDNLLELMKSRSMIEKALLTTVVINGKQQTLAEFYLNFNKFRESWKGGSDENIKFLPNAERSKFTLKQDSVLGVFYKSLIANNLVVDKLDKKLSIISIKVKSTNELFSKYFVETLAKVVSDFYIETKTKKEAKNVAVLQHQTDSVRSILSSGLSSVASSIDQNPNANPAFQVLKVPSQRRAIDVQANTAMLTELIKNLGIARLSLLQETPLIQVIDKPILPLEKIQFGKSRGIVLGGVIVAFLIGISLILIRFYNKIISNES